MTDLIERLRATRERALWTQIEGFDAVRQKVSTLINPDGLEAAAEIERLRAELSQYKEAVRRGCGDNTDEHGFYPCQYLTNIKTVYETPNCAVKDE